MMMSACYECKDSLRRNQTLSLVVQSKKQADIDITHSRRGIGHNILGSSTINGLVLIFLYCASKCL
jgi:hypothetical protein